MIEALASEQVASIPAADSSSENDHNVVQENETTADPVVRAAHGPAVE